VIPAFPLNFLLAMQRPVLLETARDISVSGLDKLEFVHYAISAFFVVEAYTPAFSMRKDQVLGKYR
jgi:hypothetical protein